MQQIEIEINHLKYRETIFHLVIVTLGLVEGNKSKLFKVVKH